MSKYDERASAARAAIDAAPSFREHSHRPLVDVKPDDEPTHVDPRVRRKRAVDELNSWRARHANAKAAIASWTASRSANGPSCPPGQWAALQEEIRVAELNMNRLNSCLGSLKEQIRLTIKTVPEWFMDICKVHLEPAVFDELKAKACALHKSATVAANGGKP